MSIRNKTRAGGRLLAVAVAGFLFSGLSLAEYVPFPGKIRVFVVSIDAADKVLVNYETWPGFSRNTLIRLPGIALPEDTPQSDDCEREKAARAVEFTRQFIAGADKVYVLDMRMETSASGEAYSDILTNHGSLSQALKQEGLARADSIAADTSWCS